jgi:hypothetical protein
MSTPGGRTKKEIDAIFEKGENARGLLNFIQTNKLEAPPEELLRHHSALAAAIALKEELAQQKAAFPKRSFSLNSLKRLSFPKGAADPKQKRSSTPSISASEDPAPAPKPNTP